MTNIAKQAFKSKHNVTVLADGPTIASLDTDNKSKFKIYRFDQLKFLRKRIKSSFADKLLNENQIDLIIFDSWKSIESFSSNVEAKKICLVHGNEILNIKNKLRIIKAFRKADKIIFNSNFTKNKTFKNFKILKKIDHQIVYPAFIKKVSKIDTTRKKYDLCTVARLEYRKGHHLVFEAMSILKKSHNIVLKYAVLGDGPELSRLKDLVMKFSLQKQVDFIYPDYPSEKIFKSSSIHVMPTLTMPNSVEGFGISNVEAASFGLPCIVSDSGGTPESISNNGETIRENNITQLVNSIIFVRKRYKTLSTQSYKFSKKFDSNLKIKEYLNIF